MRVFNQIAVGKNCTGYGGCSVNLIDASKGSEVLSLDFLRSNRDNRLIRLPKSNKDFFFLLKGVTFITYGDSETISLSSPYDSTEFVDYINRWNYEENFNAKTTDSAVFLYTHILDDVENVTVKVAVLEPGSTVKSINSNSKLILIKNENATCEIEGVQYNDDRKLIEVDILSSKNVNITVSDRSHLIYLQS